MSVVCGVLAGLAGVSGLVVAQADQPAGGMDPAVRQFLLGALIPGGLVSMVLLATWWKVGARQHAGTADGSPAAGANSAPPGGLTRHAVAPLAMGGAFVLCVHLLLGGLNWPPASADTWLPLAAVVAAVMGLTATAVRLPAAVRWVVRGVLVAALAYLSLRNFLGRQETLAAVGYVAGGTIWTLTTWWALEKLADRRTGALAPTVAWLLGVAVSQTVVLGLFALKGAVAAHVVAAAAGAAMLTAWLRPGFSLGFGGVHVPAVLLGLILLHAVALADLSVPHIRRVAFAALLLGVPLAAVAADRLLPARLTGWKRTGATVGLAGVPAAAALAWAGLERLAAAEESSGY